MKIIKGIMIGCLVLTLTACSSNGDKDATKKITLDEAKVIALKHANLEEGHIQYKETSAETDNGVFQYEIEFKDKDGKQYDYKINGNNGEIIKFDHSFTDVDQSTSTNSTFTIEQAKVKALDHANVKEADATFTQTKVDNDGGVKIYDIEFYDKNTSYEYEIGVQTGEITSYHYLKKNKSPSKGAKSVTLGEAKTLVLKDARVTDTNIKFIVAKEDTDDGIKVYELKFQNGNKTYDYEIEKATGDILSYEVK